MNTVHLTRFTRDMICEPYLSWLNDPQVTRYLEIRNKKQTRQTAEDYVRSFDHTDQKYLYALTEGRKGRLIGTASLYNINQIHGTAEWGFMIGAKEVWGTSVTLECAKLLLSEAFGARGVRKITGGSYANNHGMNFLYRRIGFSLEGRMQQSFLFEGRYVDGLRWGLLNSNWKK